MKKAFIFTFLILLTNILNSQNYFADISGQSDLVVEGEVENFQSERIKGYEFTVFEIRVTKLFKGKLSEPTLKIKIYGSDHGYYSANPLKEGFSSSGFHVHSSPLTEGEYGVFFLTTSKNHYDLLSIEKGIIKFFDYDSVIKAASLDKTFQNINSEVYRELERATGIKKEKISSNKYENALKLISNDEECVEYYIHNLTITNGDGESKLAEDYYFNFDISIRSLGESFLLHEASLGLEYSTEVFGSNIVNSGNLTLELGNDFDNDYQLIYEDEQENKLNLEITKDNGHILITNFYSNLLKASVLIENFDLNQILNLTVDEQNEIETYQFNDGVVSLIGCNKFNKNISSVISNFLEITIDSISRERIPAGSREIHSRLDIYGSGFGSSRADSEVRFSGIVVNEIVPLRGDYDYWDNEKISVFVPAWGTTPNMGGSNGNPSWHAKTGAVKVARNNGVTIEFSNSKDIVVPWVSYNDIYTHNGDPTGQPYFLDDTNPLNGHDVIYHNNFEALDTNNVGVSYKAAFEEALSRWCIATGLNYVMKSDISADEINCEDAGSGRDIVVSVKPGAIGAGLGRPNESVVAMPGISVPCDLLKCGEVHIDTFLNKNTSLSDMVGIFLHEIGHAHLLGHVGQSDDLMHPTHPQGMFPSLTPDVIEGSNYLNSQSEELNYRKRDCTSSIDEETGKDADFNAQIFSSNNNLSILWDKPNVSRISIYDIYGNLKRSIFLNSRSQSFELPFTNPSGIYICQFKDSYGQFLTSKLFYHEN